MRFVLSSIIVCLAAIALYYHQLESNAQLTATATIKSTTNAFFQRIKLLAKQRTTSNMSTSTAFPGLPVVPPSDPALTKNQTNMQPRKIANFFLAREQAEGAGARVRRSIGTPKLRNFSPFLMLDHFSIAPGAGFPDHPHRGQETITYLLQGGVDHEDFAGNRGTIHSGDLQFMTAGRGIMHAEMPVANPDGSPNVGLQLWVDLPAKLKACEPRYRDLRAAEIPTVDVDDAKVHVKVISGQSHGVDSVKELAYTPVWLLDVTIKPGGRLIQALPQGFNAFAYTLSGTARFLNGAVDSAEQLSDDIIEKESAPVGQYHNVVFEQQGDGIVVSVAADAPEEARFILVAGLPLDQKVVQYGPFVVNSQEEVYQAMMDYSTHTNGFERAKDWQSEIGKSMM
ncbi:Pirin [Lasiodiplodia theobromae]|uniref:Pirin-like protein 2 n=1 Tax=Lasiodiplodia theobromae TaxID=45133 RepID=A0A5N5D9F9_9PEZI|nr:Pirin [Lasiodiplodia theobromae]KAB2573942.1 Pirin-like protein 2 [Lasiodiplodia theobromae]KAF4538297.1 Pirin [Lasiodiplodia theobromae]KAF9633381.1 Pirin [Lasiodiplodia theobromae]